MQENFILKFFKKNQGTLIKSVGGTIAATISRIYFVYLRKKLKKLAAGVFALYFLQNRLIYLPGSFIWIHSII